MMDESQVKTFLYAFLGKKKLVPEYSVRPTGSKNRQRFLCELRVASYNYMAVGNSTSKKDAQTNAARDFLQFLVRNGELSESELPTEGGDGSKSGSSAATTSGAGGGGGDTARRQGFASAPMRPLPSLSEEGNIYKPINSTSYMERIAQMAKKEVEGQEDVDVNAGIHGNWSMDNAKGKLHQFLQMRRLNADYKYLSVGPHHNPCFVAELTLFISELRRNVYAREQASTKQAASKACALSMVRQLYHLGVIEAFTGSIRTEKNSDLEPYPVTVPAEAEQQLDQLLDQLQLLPKSVEMTDDTPVSLVTDTRLAEFKVDEHQAPVTAVHWSPPQPNWNPWSCCNIDDGPLASAPLDSISQDLFDSMQEQLKTNGKLRNMSEVRQRLPVSESRQQILELIRDNPVVLIRGSTGCGKTTQVCQFILDEYIQSGAGALCSVVVTQPRRISAVSVAERVAAERAENVGLSVGFSVRFDSQLPRPYGSILFCTVGVLLRRLELGLRGVSHVIVDEIHERDLNTDFILVVLRDMVRAYPDLRVVLMSATIDTQLFSQYFSDCPVIEVSGRLFPVEVFYLEDVIEMTGFTAPPRDAKKRRYDRDEEELEEDADCSADTADNMANRNLNKVIDRERYSVSTQQTLAALSEREVCLELLELVLQHCVQRRVHGAVLVFLPGWSVISTVMNHLRRHPVFGGSGFCILPLHSQLPRADQRRVFDAVPRGVTKVILSTNIAETSVTIDDVVFVIDSCKAKMKTFTAHNNLTSYSTVWASRDSLSQRRGRAGRVASGFCFHLCSRARAQHLQEHTPPEIHRTPLHDVALTIKLLRLGGVSDFLSKAIEPPPLDAVIEAEFMLRELRCLAANNELTALGRMLARLPLEPRLGRMLVLGASFGSRVLDCLVTVAAMTDWHDVFLSTEHLGGAGPAGLRGPGSSRLRFDCDRHSDHLAAYRAFMSWQHECAMYGEQRELSFCDAHQLSVSGLRVVSDVKRQLQQLLIAAGLPEQCVIPPPEAPAAAAELTHSQHETYQIVTALLAMGMYPNVCWHKKKRQVLTAGCTRALVHKSSVNCCRHDVHFPSPFFVFSEKIRSQAVSCKQLTMVQPVQLLLLAARRVELVRWPPAAAAGGGGVAVRLDGWLLLQMSGALAAKVTALRPALDRLIVDVATAPDCLAEPSAVNSCTVACCSTLFCLTQSADSSGGGGGIGGGPYRHDKRPRDDTGYHRYHPQYSQTGYQRYHQQQQWGRARPAFLRPWHQSCPPGQGFQR